MVVCRLEKMKMSLSSAPPSLYMGRLGLRLPYPSGLQVRSFLLLNCFLVLCAKDPKSPVLLALELSWAFLVLAIYLMGPRHSRTGYTNG